MNTVARKMSLQIVALTLLASSVAADAGSAVDPAVDSALDEILVANRHAMDFDVEVLELTGPGASILLREASEAEFLVVGEAHGNRETPALVKALGPPLRTQGYGALALEVGPFAAERLVALARTPDPIAATRDALERVPLSIPFFWWREEIEMLTSAVGAGYAIWGLDQEFIGSARVLLSQLQTSLDGEAAALVDGWQRQAEAGFSDFMTSGSDDDTFLKQITDQQLTQLRGMLDPDAHRASRIIDELMASARVYQHQEAGRYYLNNVDRIALMKQHLVDYLRDQGGFGASSKVLIKLGAAHAGRGYSPYDQLDVGNLAAELAVIRGGASFHLLVVGRYRVDGEKRDDYAEKEPYLATLDARRIGKSWTYFDLRALRPYFANDDHAAAHPALAGAVWRFDAVALAPVLHAAESLVALPWD